MKHTIKYLLCFLLISFLSCNDDDVINEPTGGTPPVEDFSEHFGSQISAHFLGRVVDENKMPLQGVTITIGTSVATTDIYGIFSINNASANENFAYITAEKEGYIKGSRAMIPSSSQANQIEIMLLEQEVIATINAGEASTVDLDNGTSVTFDGGFTTASGAAYDGAVDVVLKHLDPDNDNMSMMMPGMLFAQDLSGNAVTLETYGMLAVELKSPSGMDLQLAEGSSSQIMIPLAENTINPPSSIPLWYFDEVNGYWIEEGQATLQGNMYIGDVTHFTFWNYDYPYPSITLCITVQDENGNPLPSTSLHMYSELLNSVGTYGYTNGSGIECGLVPKDEELSLTVYSPLCASDSFTVDLGPYASDSNIIVTVPSQSPVTFTGTFLSCDGSNVTNGYIQLFVDGESQLIPVSNGAIDHTVNLCGSSTYSLKGIDIENDQLTDLISGTIDDDTTSIDLGVFSACTDFDDSDNDGVFDVYEDINGDNNLDNDDTDQDGTPNYLDEDDDGDGVNTADEDYDGDNDPTNDDTDGDGIPNYLDANDINIYDFEIPGTGCDPVTFDLNALTAEVYNNPDNTYIFYETEADAMAGTNPLSSPYTLTFAEMVSGQGIQMIFVKGTSTITGQSVIATLYLFLDYIDSDQDGLTDCEEITGIDDPATAIVATGTSDPNDPNDPNAPSYPTHGVLEACDYDNDGFEAFDLTYMDGYFANGNALVDISYFETQSDADSHFNTLPIPYTNISNPQTLYVRIDDLTTGTLIQISTLDLIINPGFNIPTGLSLTECDGDGDGFANFDLESLDDQILQGATGYVITYYETQDDADTNVNPLLSPYSNIVPNVQVIYVRVENIETGCSSVSSIDLIVDPDC